LALPLQELRHARNLSQEQLAQTLSVKQAAVSKLEKRTDMYISTLRNFIKAMGGDLEIIATFPDGSVQISQFENIAERQKDEISRVRLEICEGSAANFIIVQPAEAFL
jgi:transcriptional regulator with XRE-family HTH domain